jgi:hypothetical protein
MFVDKDEIKRLFKEGKLVNAYIKFNKTANKKIIKLSFIFSCLEFF